ncbi:trypsin-like peptidase domain-containing protein, partial [Candidatus Poribacteria bacterium]|nr:trypsin-like peptidase domain-containing protein [Candidatus Poribacteria bacterium]
MEENRELSDSASLLIELDSGNGSGFFVKKNLIATNIHVIAQTTSVSAKLVETQTEFVVEGIAAFDTKNDLVILKITGEGASVFLGDSDLLQSGDIVQAVGYPSEGYKVTEGPIHSIRDSDKWIRMGFKTLVGNSGGPVLNRNGQIIGVVVADHDWCSFAIPINTVKKLLVQTSRVEPLAQWQEREKIRAYVYLVQGQTKHCAAQRKRSTTLYEEAIVNFDKAIQLNPDYALCYYNRGTVKSQLGRLNADESDLTEVQQYYRDAIDDYTEAIKLCPDYASA